MMTITYYYIYYLQIFLMIVIFLYDSCFNIVCVFYRRRKSGDERTSSDRPSLWIYCFNCQLIIMAGIAKKVEKL